VIDVAIRMTIDNPGENISHVGKRIDVIQLTGLCCPPNYAEGVRYGASL